MKVKCTYENCSKHFSSKDAMITHKKKDPNHSYCERCDVDCEDDMLYFIHQLGSSAHICGSEYKSITARDIHVEQFHRTSQKLDCAGCKSRFTSAAALMFHIENDECSVIRLTDFQVQRAEKQLEKEAWEQESNVLGLSHINPHQQLERMDTSLGLIDDVPASRAERSLHTAIGGPISTASLQQFPPLLPSAATTTPDPFIIDNQLISANATTNDLIDFEETTVNMTRLRISKFDLTQNPASAFHQPTQDTTNATHKVKGWLDSIGTSTKPPQEDYSRVASIYDQKATPPVVDVNIPPASNVANPAPNAKHDHITTQQAKSVLSTSTVLDVERYWDAMQQQYVCPGNRCNRQFNEAQHFRDHMLSPAHVGGVVVCPSCLKRFRTTAAWVAHTESASKKCDIRNSVNFNMVMREITGGVLGTYGFMDDGTVNYVAPKIQDW